MFSVNCIVSFIVKFFSFIIGAMFFYSSVYNVFVVADKSNVICILMVSDKVSYVVFVLLHAVIAVMKVFNGC